MLINKYRTKEIMRKHGLDALVATTPENVAYLTGFWILTFLRHRPRQTYAVISMGESKPDMIVSKGLVDHPLLSNTWIREFHLYGNFYFTFENVDGLDHESKKVIETISGLPAHNSALDALVRCLGTRGLSSATIGVDQGSDVFFLPEALKCRLPGLEIKPAYDIFREIRIIKTPAEIERIRRAVEVNESALTEAIATIDPGVKEKEVAQAFIETVVRNEGLPTLVCIGSGPRSAFPNVEPGERRIEPGDVIRFDVGCLVEAYHADLARTAVLGKPNKTIKQYHDALAAGQGKIMDCMKPGVTTGRLFEIGVEAVRKTGIPHYQRQHCGHGNGIEGYDLPLISPNNRTRLEPGMVLCVETPYYELGVAGLQIEDIVLITDHGHERISKMERKLFSV